MKDFIGLSNYHLQSKSWWRSSILKYSSIPCMPNMISYISNKNNYSSALRHLFMCFKIDQNSLNWGGGKQVNRTGTLDNCYTRKAFWHKKKAWATVSSTSMQRSLLPISSPRLWHRSHRFD